LQKREDKLAHNLKIASGWVHFAGKLAQRPEAIVRGIIETVLPVLSKTWWPAKAKRNDVLSEMEYPHWMMVAGALLMVAGFIGLRFSRRTKPEPAEDHLDPAVPPNSSVVGMAEEGEETSAHESSAREWKPADDDQLREMAASGWGPFEIGRLLHRSPSAVRKRASLLGTTIQGE
jgi:hypothetical protein